jgi:hypothetical protein
LEVNQIYGFRNHQHGIELMLGMRDCETKSIVVELYVPHSGFQPTICFTARVCLLRTGIA